MFSASNLIQINLKYTSVSFGGIGMRWIMLMFSPAVEFAGKEEYIIEVNQKI